MISSGIDLVSIERISKLLQENEEAFLKRLATPKERVYLSRHPRRTEKVASLFAIKEAFSKCLGTGIGPDFSFQDVEVTYTDRGQPRIEYLGSKIQPTCLSVSVSHEGDMLVAVVIVEGSQL